MKRWDMTYQRYITAGGMVRESCAIYAETQEEAEAKVNERSDFEGLWVLSLTENKIAAKR